MPSGSKSPAQWALPRRWSITARIRIGRPSTPRCRLSLMLSVEHYAGRLLNIHPSLLPAFPGLQTHQRALEAGCQVAGATVHLVTPDLDHGPIVAQAVVPVRAADTPQTLSERVLTQELKLYPMAVRWWVEGQLAVDGLRVRHLGGAPQVLMAGVDGSC